MFPYSQSKKSNRRQQRQQQSNKSDHLSLSTRNKLLTILAIVLFAPIKNAASNISALKARALQVEPADFEEPIGNQTVAVGRDAQLSCKIKNLASYRTAWLRVEDKGILTIHNNVITRNYRVGLQNDEGDNNFILTIKNVQPSDKGGYMCQINSVPMKYSVGYLDVLTPPAFEDTPPSALANEMELETTTMQSQTRPSSAASHVVVQEGGNVTLVCLARGNPKPTITWRREDSNPILLNNNGAGEQVEVASVEGNSLTFGSVHRLNAGAYLCIASNGVQPSASRRQVLDVQYAPVLTLPQAELSAQLHQPSAQLECLVDLNPLGSYHWVKLARSEQLQLATTAATSTSRQQQQQDDLWLVEHDELTQSDKYEIVIKQVTSERVHMLLNVRQITQDDFASYKCVARNSLGLQSNSVRLYESTGSFFSPSNIFRGSSSASSDSALPSANGKRQQQQQQLDGSGGRQIQLNDEGTSTNGNSNNANQRQRAHTRSSWIQRSSGSSIRQFGGSTADASSSSAAASSWSAATAQMNNIFGYSLWLLTVSLMPRVLLTMSHHHH